jgi:hypothetical protein
MNTYDVTYLDVCNEPICTGAIVKPDIQAAADSADDLMKGIYGARGHRIVKRLTGETPAEFLYNRLNAEAGQQQPQWRELDQRYRVPFERVAQEITDALDNGELAR